MLSLTEFAAICSNTVGVDAEEVRELAIDAIRYFGAKKSARAALGITQYDRATIALERRWYDSLERGHPDFAVYDEPIMLSETWACWKLYSRKYVAMLCKPLPCGATIASKAASLGSIADLGCGPGITTLALKEVFPHHEIVGTQIETSAQFKVAARLAVLGGFTVSATLPRAGFVFASEYFEHFEYPIEHLREVLAATDCRLILFANAFGARAVGHFRHAGDTGRMFVQELRKQGFSRLSTSFWNNRPSIFERTA